jgi:glyceraldehyde 3-phosphate dehydrogenase
MSVTENGVLNYQEELEAHIAKEKAAANLQASIGKLLYEKSVELVLFRNHLVDRSTSEIVDLHNYAKKVVQKPIRVKASMDLANELLEMDLAPSKIDIGRLASEWDEEKTNYDSKRDFLNDRLGGFGQADWDAEARDVILYGFGRIGRLAARELVKQAAKGQQLRLKAIVTRNNDADQIAKRASLLKMDSVHGEFKGTVEVDAENKCMIVNGQRIHMIASNDPSTIDYTQYGISDAVVIDNTGAFRDRAGLGKHLQAKGVGKVLLTAPGKDDIPNIVYGVNHKEFDVDGEQIFSAASCTTNAISTVLCAIEKDYGVQRGHVETVHAYTNDQNLLDNMHKKTRRGRSAAINMVITETGAGKAVAKVMPEFQDKLTANAVRVPTPNGSLAIMSLELGKETTVEDLNAAVKRHALNGDLVNQIHYSIEADLVSNDIIGNTCCSVFDSKATIVHPNGKNVVIYVWYDNEYGYTKQVIRLAKRIAKVQRLLYY